MKFLLETKDLTIEYKGINEGNNSKVVAIGDGAGLSAVLKRRKNQIRSKV